jgi:hypothetical protein
LLVVSGTVELVQSMVGLLLLVLAVAVVAFWPERWSHALNRLHRST